jgi:hypothetical protein
MFDTTESRFMDLSFEKANSAYMLFYRRIPANGEPERPIPEFRPSDALNDVIAKENLRFVRHLMFFNHHYTK